MAEVSRRALFRFFGVCGAAALTPSAVSPKTLAAPSPPGADSNHTIDVFEARGKFDWFNLTEGYGFIRDEDSGQMILMHHATLRAAGIGKIPSNAVFRCEVLRRPKGLQAFRVLEVV